MKKKREDALCPSPLPPPREEVGSDSKRRANTKTRSPPQSSGRQAWSGDPWHTPFRARKAKGLLQLLSTASAMHRRPPSLVQGASHPDHAYALLKTRIKRGNTARNARLQLRRRAAANVSPLNSKNFVPVYYFPPLYNCSSHAIDVACQRLLL